MARWVYRVLEPPKVAVRILAIVRLPLDQAQRVADVVRAAELERRKAEG